MHRVLHDSISSALSVVHDGDVVFLGGFGQCVPFAAGHELIRQRRRGLTLCRTGADILADQLIAAGCVAKVVVGWIGNPGIGLAHAYRRAMAAGTLTEEQWSNYGLALRLLAGRLGVPFLPTFSLTAGDLPDALGIERVRDPYTGAELAAVPRLVPDVALVHAQRADASGNVQMWGVLGDTVDGALASRRIVVTVEEIVDADEVRAAPERTVIPGHRVSALVTLPGGARPSYVHDYYGRDDDAYTAYDRISRSPDELARHLDELVGRP